MEEKKKREIETKKERKKLKRRERGEKTKRKKIKAKKERDADNFVWTQKVLKRKVFRVPSWDSNSATFLFCIQCRFLVLSLPFSPCSTLFLSLSFISNLVLFSFELLFSPSLLAPIVFLLFSQQERERGMRSKS